MLLANFTPEEFFRLNRYLPESEIERLLDLTCKQDEAGNALASVQEAAAMISGCCDSFGPLQKTLSEIQQSMRGAGKERMRAACALLEEILLHQDRTIEAALEQLEHAAATLREDIAT